MRLTSARTAILAVTASLALASCAATAGTAVPSPDETPTGATLTPAASTPTPSPEVTPELGVVPERLQWEAITLDGAPFSGDSLYGTPTVLWFWAPWCSICQADAVGISMALDDMPEGVQIFGVPGLADEESMRAFVAEYELEGMIQIVDSDGSLWSNFSVAYQPALVLISADGTIRTLPGSIGGAGMLAEARSIA